MKIRLVIIFLIIAGLFTRCETKKNNDVEFSFENNLQPPVQLVDSIITFELRDQMEKYNISAIGITVVRDYDVIYSSTFGILNIIDSLPLNAQSQFQFGSISKPIAAFAAMKLIEMGRLKLDEDINQYLSGWRLKSDSKATIRQLLSHTAGINQSGFTGYDRSEEIPSTPMQILEGSFKNDPIKQTIAPGKQWSYSGGGYAILEKIIEDVSGLTYEEFVRENIFVPLDMTHSTYLYPIDTINTASGYDSKGEQVEGKWKLYPIPSAAGLWSTTSDVSKLCIAFQKALAGTGDFLKKETANEMLMTNKNNWGLGVEVITNEATTWFRHKGNTKGYTSIMTGSEDGYALVISVNSDVDEVLIPQILRGISSSLGWEVFDPLTIDPFPIKHERLKDYEGEYVYEKLIPGLGEYKTTMGIVGSDLFLIGSERNIRLIPTSNHTFVMYETGNQIEFDFNSSENSYLQDSLFRFNKVK